MGVTSVATINISGSLLSFAVNAFRAAVVLAEVANPGFPKSTMMTAGVITPGPALLVTSESALADSRFCGRAVIALGVSCNQNAPEPNNKSEANEIAKTRFGHLIEKPAILAQALFCKSFLAKSPANLTGAARCFPK